MSREAVPLPDTKQPFDPTLPLSDIPSSDLSLHTSSRAPQPVSTANYTSSELSDIDSSEAETDRVDIGSPPMTLQKLARASGSLLPLPLATAPSVPGDSTSPTDNEIGDSADEGSKSLARKRSRQEDASGAKRTRTEPAPTAESEPHGPLDTVTADAAATALHTALRTALPSAPMAAEETEGEQAEDESAEEEEEEEEKPDASPSPPPRPTLLPEEQARLRVQAIQELTDIEQEFASLRDRLYQDKLAQLEYETELCALGQHPELKKILARINLLYEEKLRALECSLQYRLKCIDAQTRAQRVQLHQQFSKCQLDLRLQLLDDTTKEWYKVNRERRILDSLVPEFTYSVANVDRHRLVLERNAVLTEVGELNAVNRFFGFPSAPAVSAGEAKDVEEDLVAIGIGH